MNKSTFHYGEKESCHYMAPNNCVCKMTGTGCPMWLNGHDCALYAPESRVVPLTKLSPKLAMLIRDAGEEMLFVEKGDPRFTSEDLKEMEKETTVQFHELSKFVLVDPNGKNGSIITIFGAALKSMIVD